jgi:hypothetical protein
VSKMRNGFAPLPEERNVTVKMVFSEAVARSLCASIAELRHKVGTALESPHAFSEEASLTRAAVGLGALMAELNRVAPRRDSNYPEILK